MGNRTERSRYITGFVALTLLYTVYFLLVRDNLGDRLHISRRQGHIIQFFTILAVYGAGSWYLREIRPGWLLQLWHVAHWIFIGLLAVLGPLDWLMGGLPKGWRHFTQTLGETLVSPTLYVGAILLRRGFAHLGQMGGQDR